MRPRYLYLFAGIPAVLAAACSVSAPGGAQFEPSPKIVSGSLDAGDATPTGMAQDDGGTGDADLAPIVQSSELCVGPIGQTSSQASSWMCDPDVPSTASSCDEAPDGGAFDPSADYGAAVLACRVQPSSAGTNDDFGTGSRCSVSGAGVAGAPCDSAIDCAAGFDCIGTGGTCRHYCCAGNSQCGSQEFCDIQPLATASTTRIPVCMPIVACSLESALPMPIANAQGCGQAETCGIVREDGTTGCVEVGDVTANHSCDTGHCQAGLVCLGAINARLCYELCNTTYSQCTAPMTCQGGLPLFQDPTVGVCR
jgi:hypothetical protein